MGKTVWQSYRTVMAACAGVIFAAFLAAGPVLAHVEESLPQGQETGAGLEERLGSRIPLDAVFSDEAGRRVRLDQIVTGPTIIVPVYYRCRNVCNFLQSDLARVLPEVKRRPAEEYRVISVSIDETEKPEEAAAARKMYLAAMNAPFPPSGWRFLTGDAANIRRLTDAAGFRFQRRGREFMHPVASFVVSGDGLIVRYLYGTNFLSKDVTLALIEAGQGRVGTTIRKLTSYCFTFDPAKKSYEFNLLRVCGTVVLVCCGGFFAFLLVTGRKKADASGGK